MKRRIACSSSYSIMFFAVVAFCALAKEDADPKVDPVPVAKHVKAVQIKLYDPKLKDDVEFTATLKDWQAIRAALVPAKRDTTPGEWERLGAITIVTKDGQPLHIELYAVSGNKPGAFAAGKNFEQRVYYRGGKTAELIKALNAAIENSKTDGT